MGRPFRFFLGVALLVAPAAAARPGSVQPSPAAAPPPPRYPGAPPSTGFGDPPRVSPAGTPAAGPSSPDAGALPPDLVQTIESPSGSESATARTPSSDRTVDSKLRIETGGWLKYRFDYIPIDSPPELGRNDFISRTQLFIRARYARADHLEMGVSGSLSHTIWHSALDYRGAIDPELRDAYVGLYGSDLDFRFGQQRLAWGVTDFLSPNDVLNARDLRDPFLGEEELRFIPTPMLRADWYLGIVTLQAVYAPWYVPDRYDVYGTNWSGIQPWAPQDAKNSAQIFNLYDRSLLDQAQQLYQQTKLPAADFSEPSAGAQLAINGQGFDIHFYYQYGFDGPYVSRDDPTSVLQPSVTFLRRHHVGLATTASAGPIVFRFEGAYQSQRAFFRTDLLSFKSAAAEAVGAIEWQTGDPGKVALLELYYQRIIDKPDVPLLVWEQDSYGAGLSIRLPLFGRLRTDSRILASAQPETVVGKADLELDFDDWVLGAGWLGVAGRPPSFGWYYRKNSEVFAFVKWLF
jgi:hypothetical protein